MQSILAHDEYSTSNNIKINHIYGIIMLNIIINFCINIGPYKVNSRKNVLPSN